MTSEQRVDRLCEIWFTAASRNCKLEMIAAFDNHATEQADKCADAVIAELKSIGFQIYESGEDRIRDACLSAVEKEDDK